ncbi:MAG: nickel insertion protein [Methanohalobium sp.]|uniref:nickel insertion protein n=1 Tax=Methanohalobium sp. TaxID=2837493 RepID=UPI00397B0F15
MTNVDSISCDQVPYIIDELYNKSAKNVHVVPAFTKKGRQEYVFFIDVPEGHMENIAEFMALETGTLGLRKIKTEHYVFDHYIQNVNLSFEDDEGKSLWNGSIDAKIVKNKQGVPLSARAEFEQLKSVTDDIKQNGINISIYEFKEMVEQKALQEIKNSNKFE